MDVRARQSVIPFAAIQFAASPIAAFYPANETPQSIALRASLGDERMQASIFPNPASGRCAVQIDSEKSGRELLRLIDTNGRCVWSEMTELQAGANTLEIRRQALPAGLYFLQMGTKGLGTVAWE